MKIRYALCILIVVSKIVFAEHFYNGTAKKIIISVSNPEETQRYKTFTLLSHEHKALDLSKYSKGISINVKYVRMDIFGKEKESDKRNGNDKMLTRCADCGVPNYAEVIAELSEKELVAHAVLHELPTRAKCLGCKENAPTQSPSHDKDCDAKKDVPKSATIKINNSKMDSDNLFVVTDRGELKITTLGRPRSLVLTKEKKKN